MRPVREKPTLDQLAQLYFGSHAVRWADVGSDIQNRLLAVARYFGGCSDEPVHVRAAVAAPARDVWWNVIASNEGGAGSPPALLFTEDEARAVADRSNAWEAVKEMIRLFWSEPPKPGAAGRNPADILAFMSSSEFGQGPHGPKGKT